MKDLIIIKRLNEFPAGVYDLPSLEVLLLNNNHIKEIDGGKIVKMKRLTTLNMQNNDLSLVPNELGKAVQLRSLLLEGNAFRLPRTQILAKGTEAILEYLRSRIADETTPI